MALKPHDVVVQTGNSGIWWMSAPYRAGDTPKVEQVEDPDFCLTGICILRPIDSIYSGDWQFGEACPFSIDPLDDGVEIIGHCESHEQALAIAQLVGVEGFVKGDNNEAT
jgi:hypothetical protein